MAKLGGVEVPGGTDPKYGQRYARAVADVRVGLAWVTPDDAARWLGKNNVRNRPLSGTTFRRLARKIDEGLWHVNGECVVFDVNNVLVNGQHRLHAVIASGTAVPTIVVTGVDPKAFDTYDQGKRRGASDVLGILGERDVTTLASALSWCMRYDDRRVEKWSETIPNEMVQEWLSQYPELPASVAWARASKSKVLPHGVLAFLHRLFTLKHPSRAPSFFDKVVKGIEVPRDSWEYVLRDRLQNFTSRDGYVTVEMAALCIKAFNFVVAGRPCETFRRNGRTVRHSISWSLAKNEPFPRLLPDDDDDDDEYFDDDSDEGPA